MRRWKAVAFVAVFAFICVFHEVGESQEPDDHYPVSPFGRPLMKPMVVPFGWEKVSEEFIPDNGSDPKSATGLLDQTLYVSDASVTSTGYDVRGSGSAIDHSSLGSVYSERAIPGLWSQTWKYVPDREELELPRRFFAFPHPAVAYAVKMYIAGRVNLINAEAAAAALGYLEFYNNVDNTETVVRLTSSAASTTSKDVLSIEGKPYADSPIAFTASVHENSGEGLYRDDDNKNLENKKVTDFYFVRHRSRGYVSVYANGGWLGWDTGRSSAVLVGEAESISVLGTEQTVYE